MSYSAAQIAAAWEAALAVWDAGVTLSPPAPLAASSGEHWGGNEPLAYIDLVTRQVVVNFELLEKIAPKSLPAVFAHELGHHVRFPHTLRLAAELHVLQQRLLPNVAQPFTNLFFDLQVNEFVGRTRAGELADVYRGFVDRAEAVSPLFWFYLAIYEELWRLPAGAIAPPKMIATMEATYPGCRAEARMFAQTFWGESDELLAFAYFLGTIVRYLPDPSKAEAAIPMASDVPDPDADDYAGAIGSGDRIGRALAEAARRGWIDPVAREAPDGMATVNRIASGRPGKAAQAFRRTLAARFYKSLVDKYLVPPPPGEERKPDPFLPVTLDEWEPGDNPRAIDWTASVNALGPLAAVRPLRRELEAEPPSVEPGQSAAVELYLDTSGSMPDPQTALNAMTLAAQVLSASAIRHGGKVRAVIYSGDHGMSGWMYDEARARDYLFHYAGGGTAFPFSVLEKNAVEAPGVVRVIISDADFLANVASGQKKAAGVLAAAAARSRRFVVLLSLWGSERAKVAAQLAPASADPRFRLAIVEDQAQFGAMAASLARALFE